jgi:hypothetical protein
MQRSFRERSGPRGNQMNYGSGRQYKVSGGDWASDRPPQTDLALRTLPHIRSKT